MVQAIQTRLHSPIEKIRKECMRTAELFARKLDPSNPLRFDSDGEASDSDSEAKEQDAPPDPVLGAEEKCQPLKPERKARKPRKAEDPDKLMLDSGSEESEDSEEGSEGTEESDDGLTPYWMEDEETKSLPLGQVSEKQEGGAERIGEGRVRLPTRIKECVSFLRSQKADEVEAALFAIPEVVSGAKELRGEDYAEASYVLIKLQDAFAMDDFAGRRQASLVALTCKDPLAVCSVLCKAVWNPNEMLAAKLDSVEVLRIAALEMSFLDPKASQLPSEAPKPPQDSGKSRRWSKKLSLKAPVARANEFGKYADTFFFALVSGWHSEGAARVLGSDFMLGGRILCSLGSFVECGGNSPSTRVIGKSLVQLLFLPSVRLHPQVFVRRCAQFAFMKVLFTIPESLFIDDFRQDLSGLLEWVQGAAQEDGDPEVAEMALVNLQVMAQRVSSTMPKISELDW
mmetsp:Transcript_13157/g.20650  ORF Transcript_13157/g.20650 Transcript_13157/m.20650 type:complete len:456 (-) Transcript_13157:60-1427(-)|eukprot:CAMPEP_0184329180 /NCGR_PEP_ID=MMETSP1049-20130417/144013_1 /TAXON_ID=77928 /ORGANISM="Proteomonas sulcata, Strain CCMP704" /LENGTH=455 /DNA_ID=CAMNT_0026651531 /DNA_START=778 /DNA_END=2145 /DNA_ORIENTATION=+